MPYSGRSSPSSSSSSASVWRFFLLAMIRSPQVPHLLVVIMTCSACPTRDALQLGHSRPCRLRRSLVSATDGYHHPEQEYKKKYDHAAHRDGVLVLSQPAHQYRKANHAEQ